MAVALISFTQRASAGAQAVTGVGFQPKAVILWTTWRAGTGLFDGAEICEGAGDGTTQFARTTVVKDGDTGASNGMTFAGILRRLSTDPSPVDLCAASLVSLDADGFTLSWSSSDAGGATIHAIALGGSTLRASLLTGTLPSGVSTTLTGVGFLPTAAMVWAAKTGTPTTTASFGARHSWGFAAGGVQCSCASLESAAFGRKNRSMCEVVDAVVATSMQESGILSGGAATHHRIASFDADGLTFEDAAGSYGGTADVVVLCLRGVTVAVGQVIIPTSPGTVAETAGVAPELLLLQTVDHAFPGCSLAGGARFGLGCWTAGAQVTLGAGSDSTGQFTAAHTDTAIRIYQPGATSGASTLRVAATVASIEADGFTLDCATVTGESSRIAYLAIGPIPEPSCSGGTVPAVFDPSDGLEFTGLGPHEDRVFIEIDLDSGTERYALQDPINDSPSLTAHPGRKEGRIVSIGSIVRRTTDRLGAWQASTANFTLDDGDRRIRGLIAAEQWYNREARIYVAKRGHSDDARCIFRGINREYTPKADDAGAMTVDVQLIDIIGTEFTPFSLDRDVLAGVVFDRTRFPGLPQALADQKPPQPVPALWGRWSDEGSDAAPPILAGTSARGSYFSESDGRFNVGFANQPDGSPAAPASVSGGALAGGSINLGSTPYNTVYALVWGETSGVEGDPFPFYAELLPISITANGQKLRITWTFGGSDPDHWRIAIFVKYFGPRQVEVLQVAGSARAAEFDNLPWNGGGVLASGATAPAFSNRREFLVAARMADGLTGVTNPSGIHPYGGPYKRKPYLSWLPVEDALSYEVYTGAVPAAAYFGWTQKFVVPADQIDSDGFVYFEYDWDAAGESIDGLPSPEGLLPLYDTGDETIGGIAYGKLVLCRWPIHQWLGLHAAKQSIALDHADILHADHPSWPFPERYRLCGDAGCTVLYVKVGSALLNAHRDGSAPIQANACTTDDADDGNGSTITQAARIDQDVVVELVFNDRRLARAGVPLFADGVPMVRTSSYLAAETMQIARVGGTGYVGRLALDQAGTTLRTVIESIVQSHGLHHGINRHGQVVCGHYDDAVDTTLSYPHYRDLREVVGPLEIDPRTDELENVIPYRHDYRPVTKDFAVDLDDHNTDVLDATAITANRGKRKVGPQRSLPYTEDAATIADVLQRDLLLGKYVRQWVGIPTSIIGLSTDLFDIVQLTDEEGLGTDGYQEQFILVLEHQVDPPDPSQDRPMLSTLRGLDITALADAAWVWGPDSLTDWDAMSDDERGTYGAWAADADTIPSDDSPAKEWR